MARQARCGAPASPQAAAKSHFGAPVLHVSVELSDALAAHVGTDERRLRVTLPSGATVAQVLRAARVDARRAVITCAVVNAHEAVGLDYVVNARANAPTMTITPRSFDEASDVDDDDDDCGVDDEDDATEADDVTPRVAAKLESALGKRVFWHSCAHVLGAALERVACERGDAPLLLRHGPPLLRGHGGFFYEFATTATAMAAADKDFLAAVKRAVDGVLRQKARFERLRVRLPLARRLFCYNPYKLRVLATLDDDAESASAAAAAAATATLSDLIESDAQAEQAATALSDDDAAPLVTLYRVGDAFVDLCRGPHLPRAEISPDAFELLDVRRAPSSSSSSSSRTTDNGDTAPSLLRVYGVAWPSAARRDAWHARRADAAARDHRVIGAAQRLFMFNADASPGAPFWLKHGTRIVNALERELRRQYEARGFDEIRTPLVYARALWETSGHWQNYRDDMYTLDNAAAALKPMNCPGHCLVFAAAPRSHRELPLRLADFSALHRNEPRGTLSGLTRVRKFHQDDAHIFCAPSQVAAEIADALRFLDDVYRRLGFQRFRYALATRPTDGSALGSDEQWREAETALRDALDRVVGSGNGGGGGGGWRVRRGDGAFYGPKIDVLVEDAVARWHQCGTLQLDFNLPARFDLRYTDEHGAPARPVMIHRAILGSFERAIAVLAEHHGGRWPFWLSPRQLVVLPVAARFAAYARRVAATVRGADARLNVDVDDANETIGKRIRQARLARYNYVLVVGAREEATDTVAVRRGDGAADTVESLTCAQLIACLCEQL